MSTSLIILTLVAGYILGAFITFFVICLTDSKRNNSTGKYDIDISDEVIGITMFWPIILVFVGLCYIIVGPFELIRKLALKIKNTTNLKKVDSKKIIHG